jgi:predicted amidohydrolase YtcJ
MKRKRKDLLLANAHIITLNPKVPRAGSVFLSDGRIARIFADRRPKGLPLRGLRLIDCKGMSVVPGFVDAHFHLRSFAEKFLHLDLSPEAGIGSIEDIKERIRKACASKRQGEWIKGRGYDEWRLREKRHPTRLDLDEVAPFHPVRLSHRTGQVHVLNSMGLKILGIGADSEDPEGGLIERDLKTGLPTGVLYGMGGFLSRRIPEADEDELEKVLPLASARLLSFGITFLNDCTSHNDLRELHRFENWRRNGLIRQHLRAVMGVATFEEAEPSKTKGVIMGGAKILLHRVTGRFYPDPERLQREVEELHRRGVQIALHAIEEEEIGLALEALARAIERYPRPHRHRIEHCSLCPDPHLERIASLGVVVVSQPAFIYLNGERYRTTIPEEKRRYLYRLRSFLERGVVLAAGSDSPVGDPNPMLSIFACLFRSSRDGNPIGGDEALGLEQAIKVHTLSAAYACFEEGNRGSIELGKAADLVVLNEHLESIPAERIRDIRPVLTILDGEVVFEDMD